MHLPFFKLKSKMDTIPKLSQPQDLLPPPPLLLQMLTLKVKMVNSLLSMPKSLKISLMEELTPPTQDSHMLQPYFKLTLK
jgi:hypothetical protein